MFGIHTHTLATIRSYEQAEAYFESRKCRRSEDKHYHGVSLHPSIHKDHVRLIKRDDGAAYALRYHRTDVVTYHADGTVEVDVSYASQNTARFADNYLPYRLSARFTQGRCWADEVTSYQTLRFAPDIESRWTLLNPEDAMQFQMRRVDRAKANAAWRDEKIVSLRQYLTTMLALAPLSEEVVGGGWDTPQRDLNKYLSGECGPEIMLRQATSRRWSREHNGYMCLACGDWEKRLRGAVYDVFDVYYYEPVPLGEIRKGMEAV